MILDKLAMFADAQEPSTTANSDYYIDTLAKADAYSDAWFVVRVDTLAASANAAMTLTFELLTADNTGFTTNGATLITSGALAIAALAAGKFPIKCRIPPGVRRYLTAKITVAGGVPTTGKYDMFIVKDPEINNQLIYP